MLLTTVFVVASYVYITQAWKVLEVLHTDGHDDTPTLMTALTNYAKDSTILFKQGVEHNIFSPINFPVLTNVEIRVEGNLTYPTDIPTIQAIVGSSKSFWFNFAGGTNVTLRGNTDPNWGWVDAHGQAWWDAMEQTSRPHGWAFRNINGGVIRDLKLWKPIAASFSTSGSTNLHVFNNKIVAGSNSLAFPFNTDGFSVSGTNMLFENNWIQNGDDCLTVQSGAKNIHFRNSYCEGGHGLSIGSLGNGGQVADVQNVLIENVVMKKSLYGARFKSWTGGRGLARNITWKDITFVDVLFPIFITQNYWDQSLGPRPNNTGNLTNTHIEDYTFKNFAGTIKDRPVGYIEGSCVSDPCWYAVQGATGREVAIFDLYPGTASNVLVQNAFPRTESGLPVDVMCGPTTISNDVGFVCQNGPFIPTKELSLGQ